MIYTGSKSGEDARKSSAYDALRGKSNDRLSIGSVGSKNSCCLRCDPADRMRCCTGGCKSDFWNESPNQWF